MYILTIYDTKLETKRLLSFLEPRQDWRYWLDISRLPASEAKNRELLKSNLEYLDRAVAGQRHVNTVIIVDNEQLALWIKLSWISVTVEESNWRIT
jgi:hypothetical protein